LVPTGEDPKEYLRAVLDAGVAAVSPETPMGIVRTATGSSISAYSSAILTVELLDQPERILDRPEGIVDLGVIEWLLRPALQITNGLIDSEISPRWAHLRKDIVEYVSKSVCRLDLIYGGKGRWQLGTGFTIGRSPDGMLTVMTNAHVIQEAIRFGWPSIEGLNLVCDFERYSSQSDGEVHNLSSKYALHLQHDLALVFLPQRSQNQTASQELLKISGSPPNPLIGNEVGVIGHPSFNSVYDPFPKYFGFGDSFGVKRFSPGEIRELQGRVWREHEVDLFLHDATTLSGSSGSCILDLKSLKVLGLHFGGWPITKRTISTSAGDVTAELFESNGAVPLWLLSEDPMLESLHFE
jgi:V8-like Glu-specific endopeptidase